MLEILAFNEPVFITGGLEVAGGGRAGLIVVQLASKQNSKIYR
jgi:hypothetical protein